MHLLIYLLLGQGEVACYKTNNIKVGASSWHGSSSCCNSVSDSTIDNVLCHGKNACLYVQNFIVHDGSCHGEKTCLTVKNSIIGEGSWCNGSLGRFGHSCAYSE